MRRLLILPVLAILTTLIVASPASGQPRRDHGRALRLPPPVACRDHCWHPGIRTAWQWQLPSQPAPSEILDVRMYDVDAFDTSAALIRTMHRRGIKVVCYISAGSWEVWRPDADEFPESVLGDHFGWPGERLLDIRRLGVLGPIMRDRVAMCADKGFDGIEFDNVDGYQNDTGFPLTGADQKRYNIWLANQAHRYGLMALLKNDLGQIRALEPYFDGALNEQCHQYDECGRLDRFIDAGKPVFGVEYGTPVGDFCPSANAHDFNFLKKRYNLGPFRVPCRGV
jgi:hypothetical protein